MRSSVFDRLSGRVTLHFELRNRSQFDIDTVWENAQDLEHVPVLHARTNSAFQVLQVEPDSTGQFAYRSMAFVVRRKILGLVPSWDFGYRRIIAPYELWQMDCDPRLGIVTCNRSRVVRDDTDPERTILLDDIDVTVPRALEPLQSVIGRSLARHTRIQCEEDEPFRARRRELKSRGIHLPLSIYGDPLWDEGFRALAERLPKEMRDGLGLIR